MPTKAELYAQMAEKVAVQLTGSWQEWAGFLTTAARLYKYPYHEQLMIYAQRPDATACAEYDLWNSRMGRYVRRGSKGIALVDDSGDRPRLRYVFDISDTGTREHSRTPWLWQLEEPHLAPVQAMLEERYEVTGDDLGEQLARVARKLAEETPVYRPWLFYLWGHSYEFEARDNWNVIEEFAAYIGGREDIWYATNIEVHDYVEAWRHMQSSADGNRVLNLSALTLYIRRGDQIFIAAPGQETVLA